MPTSHPPTAARIGELLCLQLLLEQPDLTRFDVGLYLADRLAALYPVDYHVYVRRWRALAVWALLRAAAGFPGMVAAGGGVGGADGGGGDGGGGGGGGVAWPGPGTGPALPTPTPTTARRHGNRRATQAHAPGRSLPPPPSTQTPASQSPRQTYDKCPFPPPLIHAILLPPTPAARCCHPTFPVTTTGPLATRSQSGARAMQRKAIIRSSSAHHGVFIQVVQHDSAAHLAWCTLERTSV